MEQVPTLISQLDTTDSILTLTVNALEGFSSDILPPEGDFNSRKAVFDYVNSWAKPRGYAFTTGKSLKTSNGRVKVFFACDRNKPPPNPSSNRKRRTSSQRTNCLFSVVAKDSLDGTTWALRHRPDPKFCEHNHPPSTEPSVHRVHRRLPDEEANVIADLTTAGVPPREIRTYIRQTSNALATQQDVYNLAASTRRKLVQGQSSIQALVNQLNDEDFWSRVQVDAANRLTAIFFAHPDSVTYLQQNPDILILDCTYKTNKYGLPLLDMIGVDCCQRSFCIAFAFLSNEVEEQYMWALTQLKSLYQDALPSVILTDRCVAAMNAVDKSFLMSRSLLCLWHANKAVVRHCQPSFGVKRGRAVQAEENLWKEFYTGWHTIVASNTELVFQQRFADFQVKYAQHENCLEPLRYIKDEWLDVYKEKIVKAWVDRHLHFGNVATSR
ncbi:Hypothetical protein PENO1_111880 [Penicillium occitanis (nom. inval.)]|nr:Hypothetical protein PENO1_111880 [Penicillium occitanis (nom. inval.)]